VVDALPLLRAFRFPSKAYFTVHLAVALLAALGVQRLAEGSRGAWRTLLAWCLGSGGLLVGLAAVPALLPGATRWFLAGFLPPGYSWPGRFAVADAILADAGRGGLLAVALAMIALLALAGRLPHARAAALAAALAAADLWRAGSGLNPMVTPEFYRPSAEAARLAASVRASGGRLYTCNAESEPLYFRARALRAQHDAWTFALVQETLTPATNLGLDVLSALSQDLTMLVPTERVLDPDQMGSAGFDSIAARLPPAGVSRVACIAPIRHPALRPLETLAPARIAPLRVHLYEVAGAAPLRSLAGGRILQARETPDRLELEVEADAATRLMVRDAFARGWSATVDGAPAPVLRAEGRHRAVPVPGGRSRVVLRYDPPGLGAGLAVGGLALLAVLGLAWRG
jgi:hypothetical protein